jgi:hypothetical protein
MRILGLEFRANEIKPFKIMFTENEVSGAMRRSHVE